MEYIISNECHGWRKQESKMGSANDCNCPRIVRPGFTEVTLNKNLKGTQAMQIPCEKYSK